MIIPNAIPVDICETAWDTLRTVGSKYSGHRGLNTGNIGSYHDDKLGCRPMPLSAQDVRRYPLVLPLIQRCADVFREHLPVRYAAQQAAADRTDPEWIIENTCFTTTAVNLWDATHTGRTRPHRDKGDLPAGFGVISILRGGNYRGGELIFPKYKVGFDLKTTDVLLADVHEIHGNNGIVGEGNWERIATISYFRTGLLTCPKQKGTES